MFLPWGYGDGLPLCRGINIVIYKMVPRNMNIFIRLPRNLHIFLRKLINLFDISNICYVKKLHCFHYCACILVPLEICISKFNCICINNRKKYSYIFRAKYALYKQSINQIKFLYFLRRTIGNRQKHYLWIVSFHHTYAYISVTI